MIINLKRSLLSILILILFFISDNAVGGKIYKWVDENGVVHFSDRPPDTSVFPEVSIHERDVKDVSPVEGSQISDTSPRPINPIEHTTNCTFTIKGSHNLGTAFFISPNGYAVTCKHVIKEGRDFVAILNDQKEFPISIISSSYMHDLALILVITSQKTPYLSLRDPETVSPGERIFAVGSSVGLQSTVTDGVFTGLRNRKDRGEKVIQFSAPINPGNSGGPLIDEEGKVIGVVSMKYAMQEGIPIAGVGFAIPSKYMVEEYSAYIHKK